MSEKVDMVNIEYDRPADEPSHFVYRVFDMAGGLLYVGCSRHVNKRLSQHRSLRAPWINAMASVRAERFDTREAALAAESAAIWNESPAFNERGRKPIDTAAATYAEQVARAVLNAIRESGSSISEVSRSTYIPFTSLRRKLTTTPGLLDMEMLDQIAQHLSIPVEQLTAPGRAVA